MDRPDSPDAGLVALVARQVEDDGPAPGVVVHNDEDYETSLQTLLRAEAWSGQDVWVFAYGSLMWNPGIDVAEHKPAVLQGWHRAFCIRLTRFSRHSGTAGPDDVAGARWQLPWCSLSNCR
jgi:hypothetical protein